MNPAVRFKIVIPARYASTRLPGKPLLEVAGRTLLEHVWRCAGRCGAEQVVIATDDGRIESAARTFGAEVCMTDPDHPSGTDRLAEVVARYAWPEPTLVVNLQGDEPLTPPQILVQVAENLHRETDAGMATLCTPIDSREDYVNPNVVKVVRDRRGFAMYFSRAPIPFERDRAGHADPAPGTAFRHLGIYAYRAGFLRAYPGLPDCEVETLERLEQLRALWNGVGIHCDVANHLPGPGVDTPEDLPRVEALLSRFPPGR